MLALARHPHAHHTLACRSTGNDKLSRCRRWSDTRFLLASQAYFSFSSPSLSFFHPAFFRSAFFHLPLFSLPLFSSERTSRSFLYLRAIFAGAVRPKLTPPHWRTVTMTTRALSKKEGVGAHERLLLRKNGRRASELVKEMCVNVSVVKKKASHKRGDLFFYPSQCITFKIPLDMGMGLI